MKFFVVVLSMSVLMSCRPVNEKLSGSTGSSSQGESLDAIPEEFFVSSLDASECSETTELYELNHSSLTSWFVIKNGEEVVNARHMTLGHIKVVNKLVESISGLLVFDHMFFSTGNEIRDKRLRDIFFFPAGSGNISFTPTSVEIDAKDSEASGKTLPKNGASFNLIVHGNLNVGTTSTPIAIPATLTAGENDSLWLRSPQPISIDLVETLGLEQQLNSLIELTNNKVGIEKTIDINFDLTLDRVCTEEEAFDATWEGGVRNLIENHCISCHGPGGSFPEMDNQNKFDASQDIILNSLKDGRMPPGKKLNPKDIETIHSYYEVKH